MDRPDRAGTRGRILAPLCGGNRTASELSEAIGISRSAVRMHLGGLEEEGLVEHERVIRGVGKPAHRYRLAPAGEGFLSRAYLPLTEGLLGVLASRLEGEEVDALLREVGRRWADRQSAPQGDGSVRVKVAAELIEMLGGIVEVEAFPGGATICGRCCPVAAIAPEYPQVCAAIEEMLAASTGLSVREHCDRTGRPSCRFDVSFRAREA